MRSGAYRYLTEPAWQFEVDLRHSASGRKWRQRLAVIEPKPVCPTALKLGNHRSALSRSGGIAL